MKNHWINQIRIRNSVNLLTLLINDEFRGEVPNTEKWLEMIDDLIDAMWSADIVILNGLMKYELVCHLDNFGLVESLEFIIK